MYGVEFRHTVGVAWSAGQFSRWGPPTGIARERETSADNARSAGQFSRWGPLTGIARERETSADNARSAGQFSRWGPLTGIARERETSADNVARTAWNADLERRPPASSPGVGRHGGPQGRGGADRNRRRDGSLPDARAASPRCLCLGSRHLFRVLPRKNLPERLLQVIPPPHPHLFPRVFTRWQWWNSRWRSVPAITSSPASPPLLEPLVRSRHRRGSLVDRVDPLKEEGPPAPDHRQVADLVHHAAGRDG